MHLFVDESGAFIPLNGSKSRISCVGVVVVPDTILPSLLADWAGVKRRLRPEALEIKGSELKEDEIQSVVRMLLRHDVVFDAACVDAGRLYADDLDEFQKAQARTILGGLTDAPSIPFVEELRELAPLAEQLSRQEYLQTFVTIRLLQVMVPSVTNYYAQRRPRELEHYHWIIDAKGRALTRSEHFWKTLILPALETATRTEPFGTFEFGDYTYFERHRVRESDTDNPAELRLHSAQIYQEHLTFSDSKGEEGLQLADIVTNAYARLFNGGFTVALCHQFGRLMIRSSPSPVRFVAPKTRRLPRGPTPERHHQRISHALYAAARPMIARKFEHLIRASDAAAAPKPHPSKGGA